LVEKTGQIGTVLKNANLNSTHQNGQTQRNLRSYLMHCESRLMTMGCRCAIAGLAVVAVGTSFSRAAIAEDLPLVSGVPFGEIPQKFNDAYFSHERNFYGDRTLGGQLKFLFGPFVENSITRDGKAVNEVYREVLNQQMNAGPIIRTVDLPNPFVYSVRNLPTSVVIIPNDVPPPVTIFPQAPQPLPKPMPQKPVPGLW
jgi:hypothetical protein